LRYVFDTNVVVSAALLAGSVPRQAFAKALDKGKILISVPTLLELAEVLNRKKLNRYLLEEERMRFSSRCLKRQSWLRLAKRLLHVEMRRTINF
jgi:predicted nucleic acid-binding protein